MHNLKTFILVLCTSFASTAIAKTAKLVVNNMAPRVGDEIEINVVFSQSDDNTNEDVYFEGGYLVKSDIKINKMVTQAGTLWVGPFTFKINGEELTTDSISIEVAETIPVESNQVVVRQVRFQNQEYLVVEQQIKNVKNNDKEFSKININSIEKAGMKITEKRSFSTSNRGRTNYRYEQTVYLIEKKANFSNYTITQKDFNNLPADVQFQQYIIQ